MRIFSRIEGRLTLVGGLALLGACTSGLEMYPTPTDEASAGGGGSAPDGGAGSGGGGGAPVSTTCRAGEGTNDMCAMLDLTPGLVAYFPFDGDTQDATGHGHDGVAAGDVSFIPEGRHVQALFLSGTEARVVVPDDPALDTDDAFTLAAWVQPSSYPKVLNDYPAIISKWLNSPDQYDYLLNVLVGENEGLVAFSVGDIEHRVDDGILAPPHEACSWQLPTGAFTHVAATFDHGALRLFINGQLAAEKTSDITRTSPVEYEHDDVIIGNVYTDITHNYTWQGAIDDVRIYDRALSAEEIDCLAGQ